MSGYRVLVTRPGSQTSVLANLVRRAGGEPILFPTIEIESRHPPTEQIDRLGRSDMVIFISANAVTYGYPFLQKAGDSEKTLVAIGPSTKKALEASGCLDVHGPDDQSSSEILLEHQVTQDVGGLNVCIVRGQGGRETLERCLTERGARVSFLECYQRRLPARGDTESLVETLADTRSILVVSATSVVGLSNLIEMVPAASRPQLMSRPLVVIGARQKTTALGMGWDGPVLESGAGDHEIVAAIVEWCGQR